MGIFGPKDFHVLIGVNERGIYIIDQSENVRVLMFLKQDNLQLELNHTVFFTDPATWTEI